MVSFLASRVEVGAAEIFSEKYFGRRWIHWEASAGRVCLREVWLDRDLIDHAICLKLGGNLSSIFKYYVVFKHIF